MTSHALNIGRVLAPDRHLPIAVVSTAVPPSASGQSRVLEQLLLGVPRESCTFFSDQTGFLRGLEDRDRLGRYVSLRQPQFLLAPGLTSARLTSLNNRLGLNATIFQRSGQIVAELRAKKPAALIACSGNPFDLPAAFLASRRLRVPFVAYLFDDPVFQWPTDTYRGFALFWERIWGRRAALVVVPNEVLRDDFLKRRRGAKVTMVRNPVADAAFRTGRSKQAPPGTGPLRLVYTGSVYHAQGDAFRNLLAALDVLDAGHQLHVYSSQSQADFEAQGLVGPHVVRHEHVPSEEAYRVQHAADVLFLPLAFRSSIQDVIRSSAPAKMAEYLASGRPVLVHAPADSFISSFFRERGCGIVVDVAEPALLAEALKRVAKDEVLRAGLIGAAAKIAPEFHAERAREAFWTALARVALRGRS